MVLFPPHAQSLRALIVGGRGGISNALMNLLRNEYVIAAAANSGAGLKLACTSRDQVWVDSFNESHKREPIKAFKLDVADEADFEAMTHTLQEEHPKFRPNVIINATGKSAAFPCTI